MSRCSKTYSEYVQTEICKQGERDLDNSFPKSITKGKKSLPTSYKTKKCKLIRHDK